MAKHSFCPHCGAKLEPSSNAPPQEKPHEQPEQPREDSRRFDLQLSRFIPSRRAWLTVALCVLPISGLVGFLTSDRGDIHPKDADVLEACYAAKKLITSSLRTSETANFQDVKEWHAQNIGERRYLVSGWVEAQNAFGVMLKQTFIAEVQRKPDVDYWKLISLEMGQ